MGKQALEVGRGSNRIISGELPWVHGKEAASRVGPSDLHQNIAVDGLRASLGMMGALLNCTALPDTSSERPWVSSGHAPFTQGSAQECSFHFRSTHHICFFLVALGPCFSVCSPLTRTVVSNVCKEGVRLLKRCV